MTMTTVPQFDYCTHMSYQEECEAFALYGSQAEEHDEYERGPFMLGEELVEEVGTYVYDDDVCLRRRRSLRALR